MGSVVPPPQEQDGIYSELMGLIDPLYESLIESASLQDEIFLLRTLMVRVLGLLDENAGLELTLKVLNAVGSASVRVMNLHKTQHALSLEKGSEVGQALRQALQELSEELEL